MNISDMPWDVEYDVLFRSGSEFICSACKSPQFHAAKVYFASRPAVIPPWWLAMFVKPERPTRPYLAVTCFDCGKVHRIRPGSLPPFQAVTEKKAKKDREG